MANNNPQTYNDGEGVTTVVWMDADFAPVEPGSDDAAYVKMIASTGEMSFYHVNQDRELGGKGSGNFGHAGRPGQVGGSSSEGGSSSSNHAEVRTKLSSGKLSGSSDIHGSANSVKKITLVDEQGHKVEAIFKPTSGESWTEEQMWEKHTEAMREQYSESQLQEMEENGDLEFGGDPEELVRETISNTSFQFAAREVAAYELDEALGLGVVPPTVYRKVGDEWGMTQQFIETDGMTPDIFSKVDQDSVYALAILDIATGNTDRHAGNVLIDKSKKIVAIDQGLTFPDDTSYGNNYQFRPDATIPFLISNQSSMSEEMSNRIAENLASNKWADLTEKWRMSTGELDAFIGRMQKLKKIFSSSSDARTRSQGVRNLIAKMMEESKIAYQYAPSKIKEMK